jgi:hypothetical protein
MVDEWGLSMEELDSLKNNAKKQLAERQRSSSSASVSPPGHSYPGQYHYRPPTYSSQPNRESLPSSSHSKPEPVHLLCNFVSIKVMIWQLSSISMW